MSVRDLMGEIKRQIPETEVRYHGRPIYYIDAIDNGRLCNDVGFRLKYDIAAGIREQIARQRALNDRQGSGQD